MSVKCPKCGAGKVSLYLTLAETVVAGRVEAVSCRICGTWVAHRPAPGSYPQEEQAKPAVVKGKGKPYSETPGKACSLRGCEGVYHRAQIPLCPRHRKRLSNYMDMPGGYKRSPILRVNGYWIERVVGLPGLPGLPARRNPEMRGEGR